VLDEDVRRLMHRNRSDLSTGISDVSVEYGSGLNMLLLAAGGYAVGLASGDEWLRETALLTGTAILIAGSLSTVTKIMVGRSRPYMDRGHMSFKPLSFSTEDFVSFPSGHTVVAFAVSGVLAERIKNVWASIGLYGLAGATAWSRMYTDHHWVSDVVFGAALSVAVSRSLVQWHEGGEGITGGGLTIAPRGDGLVILWIF
jgi:membrane-associated phospholipid phosphatase